MPVKGIVDYVSLTAYEPFEEGRVGIVQDSIPFLEPLKFFGALRPKRLGILQGILISTIVFFYVGDRNNLGGRIIEFISILTAGRLIHRYLHLCNKEQ